MFLSGLLMTAACKGEIQAPSLHLGDLLYVLAFATALHSSFAEARDSRKFLPGRKYKERDSVRWCMQRRHLEAAASQLLTQLAGLDFKRALNEVTVGSLL